MRSGRALNHHHLIFATAAVVLATTCVPKHLNTRRTQSPCIQVGIIEHSDLNLGEERHRDESIPQIGLHQITVCVGDSFGTIAGIRPQFFLRGLDSQGRAIIGYDSTRVRLGITGWDLPSEWIEVRNPVAVDAEGVWFQLGPTPSDGTMAIKLRRLAPGLKLEASPSQTSTR